MQPTKDGIERYCKKEAARRATLPDAPGHWELSPVFSCKFNLKKSMTGKNHSHNNFYDQIDEKKIMVI